MNSAAIRSAILVATLSDAMYEKASDEIKAIVDVFKEQGSTALVFEATTTLSDLQQVLAGHLSEFSDFSDKVKAAILQIIVAGNNDGNGASLDDLLQTIKDKNPDLKDRLGEWVGIFGDQFGNLNDVVGVEEKDLESTFKALLEQAKLSLIDNNNGLSSIFDKVTGGIQKDMKDITGSIEDSSDAIPDYIDSILDNFEKYEEKVDEAADATGVASDDLDNALDRVVNTTEDVYEAGLDAAYALWEQANAAWDAQQNYEELAQAIRECVYAMQQLAAESVVPDISAFSSGSTFNGLSNIIEEPIDYGDYDALDWTALILRQWDNLSKEQLDEAWNLREQSSRYSNYKSNEYVQQGIEDFFAGRNTEEAAFIQDAWNNRWKWGNPEDDPKIIAGFATGGYTGEFDNGKLAILHEKELVLNPEDTENILAAVEVTRAIASAIKQLDNEGLAAMTLLGSRLSGMVVDAAGTQTLEQHVTIENVSFPSVTSSREIEEAFENLVNDAAQWARRRKS